MDTLLVYSADLSSSLFWWAGFNIEDEEEDEDDGDGDVEKHDASLYRGEKQGGGGVGPPV